MILEPTNDIILNLEVELDRKQTFLSNLNISDPLDPIRLKWNSELDYIRLFLNEYYTNGRVEI